VRDVPAMVRDSLRRHADGTPPAGQLLASVHRRSRQLRRRRAAVAVALTAAAVASLAVPIATRAAEPAGTATTVAAARAPVRLAPPAYTVPSFPFRPGAAPVGGLAAPVVTLERGELTAYYEARDPARGADVTIRVGSRPPAFTGPADRAGPASETHPRVRGGPGTLRRVAVAPAARLTLYWPEAADRWVWVDTDDTLTDAELVRFADKLLPASVPVVRPFRFDLAPAGMALDTATVSRVALRPPAGPDAAVACTLLRRRPLTGPEVRVGPYRGVLTRTGSGAALAVDVTDWAATLLVEVPAAYEISDADLIRFAAGVHVLDRSEPATR
jgi:hypothetical protein